jgi:hypothetical protein
MIQELMQRIIETWGTREPNAQYRLVPGDGWYPVGNQPISCPRTPDVELEPYVRYCIVQDEGRVLWRLYRHPVLRVHVLSRMEIDTETDTIVNAFWMISGNELAALVLNFIDSQDASAQQGLVSEENDQSV